MVSVMEKGHVIRLQGNRSGAGLTLGDLEYKVYNVVCKKGKATVREIVEELGEKLAYTTIMTTCDRLAKKGVFNRTKCGKSYVYETAASKEDLDVQTTCRVLGSVIGSLTEPVVANFIDMLEETDSKKLDMLERMIKERKNAR